MNTIIQKKLSKYAMWKKTVTKDHISYDSVMWIFRIGKSIQTETVSVVA